jgi:hypothetical protein
MQHVNEEIAFLDLLDLMSRIHVNEEIAFLDLLDLMSRI